MLTDLIGETWTVAIFAFVFGCIMGAAGRSTGGFAESRTNTIKTSNSFASKMQSASMMRLDDDIQVTRPGGAKGSARA